jgi:CheY-like chemotaxis protein
MVLDDEHVIANTLAIILNHAGFEARAVFSGEQAIELLESFQPEMLIADVVMPGMTGIEAAIAIRNKLPKCNILLFSGQAATTELLERARTQGHEFEILAKPVHPSDLLAKLRVSSILSS